MSAIDVVIANTAMISDATVMSNPVSRGLSDGDLAEESIVHVDDAPPRDLLAVDVETRERAAFLGSERVRVRLIDAELLEALEHGRGEDAGAVLAHRAEAVEERLVLLRELVEHAGVDRGGEKVVGDADGVDVAGEVEVHLLHGDDLGIAAAGGAALDAEGGTHGGLADARDAILVEMRAHRLREADGGGGLALAEGGGVDAGDDDVVPLAALGLEAGGDLVADLRLVVTVRLVVRLGEPARGRDGPDGDHRRSLRDVDVRGDGRHEVRELAHSLTLGGLDRAHHLSLRFVHLGRYGAVGSDNARGASRCSKRSRAISLGTSGERSGKGAEDGPEIRVSNGSIGEIAVKRGARETGKTRIFIAKSIKTEERPKRHDRVTSETIRRTGGRGHAPGGTGGGARAGRERRDDGGGDIGASGHRVRCS